MKLILLLILVQSLVLIECTQKRNLSTHKRQNLHETTMTETHSGSRQGSRSNSTRDEEKVHSNLDSNGRRSHSHSKHHENQANNQQQEEEEYHRSGSGNQWSNGKHFPWQKPNNPLGSHNGQTLKPIQENNGFGQGFQDENDNKKPHGGYNPFGKRPHIGKTPNEEDNNNELGQEIDGQKPHIGEENGQDGIGNHTTVGPKKERKNPWNKRRCNPFGLKPCGNSKKPHTENNNGLGQEIDGRRISGKKGPNGGKATPNGNEGIVDRRIPGKKGPNGGKATPNGNNPQEEEIVDPGKFNPGLFCEMSRKEKCKQIQDDFCPSPNSHPEITADCLRKLCSDREIRCTMLRKMANQCNHATFNSPLVKEMCD